MRSMSQCLPICKRSTTQTTIIIEQTICEPSSKQTSDNMCLCLAYPVHDAVAAPLLFISHHQLLLGRPQIARNLATARAAAAAFPTRLARESDRASVTILATG